MANERIKSLSILDKDYLQWIKELSTRFRRSQVKASVKVNKVMLQFYWELGGDIVEKKAESRWGSGFMKNHEEFTRGRRTISKQGASDNL